MKIQAELNFVPCAGERQGVDETINLFMNGLQNLMQTHQVSYIRAWEQGNGKEAEALLPPPSGGPKPD